MLADVEDPGNGASGTRMAGVDLSTAQCLLAYADDELISSHTLAHLCDLAGPAMEAMIAVLSYVQDDTAHSLRWYELAAPHFSRSVDELVYLRESGEFLSSRLADVESSDWFVVVTKNVLYKAADVIRQEELLTSGTDDVRQIVERTLDEDRFHESFWITWGAQLRSWDADKLRTAALALAAHGRSMFELPAFWSPDVAQRLHATWAAAVAEHLPITEREVLAASAGHPRGDHSQEFAALIGGMQSVHRAYPGGVW